MNILQPRATPSQTINHGNNISAVIFLARKIKGNLLQIGTVKDLQSTAADK
jgi:hypothetical protein